MWDGRDDAPTLRPVTAPTYLRSVAGDLNYYSAASQVLPLIFIGLAFEARYFTSRRTNGLKAVEPKDGENVNAFWSIGAMWVAGLLVAGEAAALDALHDGAATPFEQGLVGTAMASGGFALCAPLAAAQLRNIHAHWRKDWPYRLFFVLLLALFTLATMDRFG